MRAGRKKLYDTPEEMEPIINKYFKDCDDKREVVTDEKTGRSKILYEPYTVSGLCIYLNMCRDSLCEYQKDPRFSDTIKKAKYKIENWLEKKSLMGITNPAVSIFNLKNNFGWKDKTETEISNPKGEAFRTSDMTDEEIKARILELQGKVKK